MYKLAEIDYKFFESEYPDQEKLLAGMFEKNICPKEKFFFVKAFSFEVHDSVKIYTKTIEYVAVNPTDIYTIYDFYMTKLNRSNDISYILSYKEIEQYNEIKKAKRIVKIKNGLFGLNKVKKFVMFINENTREKEFEIVHAKTLKDFDNYINKKKISDMHSKLVVDVSDMNHVTRVYELYTKGKIKKNDIGYIVDLIRKIQSSIPFFNKPILMLIDMSINYSYPNDKKKASEESAKIFKRYIEDFKEYTNDILVHNNYDYDFKMTDEYFRFFSNIFNDVTLYRHSDNYISDILEESYDACIKDNKDVEDALALINV